MALARRSRWAYSHIKTPGATPGYYPLVEHIMPSTRDRRLGTLGLYICVKIYIQLCLGNIPAVSPAFSIRCAERGVTGLDSHAYTGSPYT
jgi:hypothetical protein